MEILKILVLLLYLKNYLRLRPDYPNKIFSDRRNRYFLLMETLAEHACYTLTQ